MNIEQFEYIVEVAKTNSVSIASENLHVSQSAISQSITKLESELGVKIFNRSRLGTYPTEEGEKVIQKAYEVLLKVQELEEETKTQKAKLTGDLKVSIIPNMMMLMFNTLFAFKKDHPHVNIEIIEKGSGEVLEDIKQNKIDIGLLTTTEKFLKENDQFNFEKLITGTTKIFVGKDHPLAKRKTVKPEELLSYSLVLFKSKHVKQVVDNISAQYGPANILFTTDSNDVIKKATIDCLGIGIGTNHTIKFDPHVINGDIVLLDLINFNQLEDIYFGWIRNKGQVLGPAAKEFITQLKKQIKLQMDEKNVS
ncbi:LysR family transcriptional regulator [Bacillus sp. Marseille-P3661]|uniref:LysR family transcriptional regulator n=1 Tax=Bacillus sp. Marseille-P3661 TaxID=1936234 RepID=UPI000C854D07|nr:LysR family transcriptional regulator [Bacillus sp. Marseille-P3661]